MKDAGLLLLRVCVSMSMLPHGWTKLMKLIEGSYSFADPIGIGEIPTLLLAVFAELICSIMLIIGYKTKLAAIPLAFTMFVAAFIVHFGDSWGTKELAIIYLISYIAISLLGPGKYSIDRD